MGQEPPANCVPPAAPDWEPEESRPATGVRKLQRALTEAELDHMATRRLLKGGKLSEKRLFRPDFSMFFRCLRVK